MSNTAYLEQPCHLDLIAYHHHRGTELVEGVLQNTTPRSSVRSIQPRQTVKKDEQANATKRTHATQTYHAFELEEEQIGKAW